MNSIFSFKQLRDKFYSLSVREQLMVVVVVGVGVYFIFESLVFTPQINRNNELMAARALLDSQVAALKAEILVATKTNVDLEKAQLENAKIKKQLENLQAVLSSMQVSKPQIGELVKSALKDYPHVTLVSLKTLPVTTLIAAVQANRDIPVASIAAEKPIYKHGVEVEIHGGYLDLLAYIKNLEDNSQNVFWSDARLLTVKYPETSLRLTIFILSDQPILEIS